MAAYDAAMESLADALGSTLVRELAYFVAACLCLAAAVRSANRPGARDGAAIGLWAGAAVLLILLALSRQVELSVRVTDAGRALVRREGWYSNRRPAQTLLVCMIVGFAGLLALTGSLLQIRRHPSQLIFGWLALAGLVAFVGVRAVSLHDVDALLYRRSLAGIQINAIAELVVTLLVALAAILAAVAPRRAGAA